MGDEFGDGHRSEDHFNVPSDQSYRTCSECGGDCVPEPTPIEEGMQIAFTCPEHGVHSIIDPFSELR